MNGVSAYDAEDGDDGEHNSIRRTGYASKKTDADIGDD